MARKTITRNISYDDEKHLFYVNMDYGKNERGKRIKTAKTFKTKTAAVEALQIFEADKVRRRLVLPSQDTVRSFGRYWLDFEKTDLRETTQYAYSVTLNNHIIPYFGEKPLQKVKREDIYKYFVHLSKIKKMSSNTIRKHYDLLCAIFTSAEQSEKIYVSPMKSIRPPKPEPYDNMVYNPNQIIELLKAAEGEAIELAIQLAIYLGLRRGEICGLRWDNVDLFRRTVRIVDSRTMAGAAIVDGPVKTDSSERQLKLSDSLVTTLLAAQVKRETNKRKLGKRYEDKGYVFCYENGRPYRPNYLSHLFALLLEQHGLPHIRFHDLRHTHGSIAILSAPLYDVSKSLGHSRQEITQRIYIKELEIVKSAAVDSVDDALKAAMAGR